MIRSVSPLLNPRFLRNVSRSSSLRATIASRAARMPARNGMGELSAKRSSAGAAWCAKRCPANLLCRIEISSKPSAPQMLRFMQTARR